MASVLFEIAAITPKSISMRANGAADLQIRSGKQNDALITMISQTIATATIASPPLEASTRASAVITLIHAVARMVRYVLTLVSAAQRRNRSNQ
jgi:hypothetical protein